MQLSELTGKTLRVGKAVRGVCVGVGISLKSRTAKYLLCSSQQPQQENISGNGDFAVSIASVEDITDEEISLPRLRSVFPKNCAKLFIGKPIFSEEGVYLGKIEDVHLQNMIVTQLTTNKNATYSALSLAACSDVVILRKELPFPIGQRIPAPLISAFLDKNDVVVTKAILREAAQNGNLVRLTLSLPPFQMNDLFPKQKKRRFF
jgi:hypothetical protein